MITRKKTNTGVCFTLVTVNRLTNLYSHTRIINKNIGTQFCRMYEGKSSIRQMADEDLEFHRMNLALCASCD